MPVRVSVPTPAPVTVPAVRLAVMPPVAFVYRARSMPRPPLRMSLPAPPSSTSLPSSPLMVSLSAVPMRVSSPVVPLMIAIGFLVAVSGATDQCCSWGRMKGLVAYLFAAQPRISGEWPEVVRDVATDMIAFLEYDQCPHCCPSMEDGQPVKELYIARKALRCNRPNGCRSFGLH